jgi:hypothetical protein
MKINIWICVVAAVLLVLHGFVLNDFDQDSYFEVTLFRFETSIAELVAVYLSMIVFTFMFVKRSTLKARAVFAAYYGIVFSYVMHLYGVPFVGEFIKEMAGDHYLDIIFFPGAVAVAFYITAALIGSLFYFVGGRSNIAGMDELGNVTNLRMETVFLAWLAIYVVIGESLTNPPY